MPKIISSKSLAPVAKSLGGALATKRVAAEMRQEDIASLTGLSVDTIQRIEGGLLSVKFESVLKYMAAVDATLPADLSRMAAR